MKNSEIRKKALSNLSYCWIEAEFLFLVIFASCTVFVLGSYVTLAVFVEELKPLTYPLGVHQLIDLYKTHKLAPWISFAFITAAFIIMTPLFYGIKWCYFQAAQGKPAPASGAFYGYFSTRKWIKTIKLSIWIYLHKIIYLIPTGAVCAASYLLAYSLAQHKPPYIQIPIYIGWIVIIVAMYIIYSIQTVKFDLIPYIFSESSEKSVREIYYTGTKAMEGHAARHCALKLWFLPLLLLCFAGFPAMIIIPVYSLAKAISIVEIYSAKDREERLEQKEMLADVRG